MRTKVTTDFKGRPDNEADTRTIKAGETITGDLAAVAVREKWAEREDDGTPAGNDTTPGGDGNDGEDEGDGNDAEDLAGMKKAELLQLAEDEGVPVDHGMTKAVLIAAIIAARAAKDA